MTMQELAGRVEALERENRRLKVSSGVVLVPLITVVLLGALMPQTIPDVIQARAFLAVDEDGVTRGFMGTGGIAYRDEGGTTRVQLSTDGITYQDGDGVIRALVTPESIAYLDPDGILRAEMSGTGIRHFNETEHGRATSLLGSGVAYADPDGTVRFSLTPAGLAYADVDDTIRATVTTDGFAYYDQRGGARAELGSAYVNSPSTGAKIHYPSAVVLYDEDGNVIWRAPR